jgi:Homeodomain-like domain
MPWLETAPMEQRERFIRDHRWALYTMTELSAPYGISWKTGYKWLDRFDEGGRNGLGDRSRAPQRCPHKISAAVATLICAARRQHPSWGPDKLLAWLRRRHYEHPGVVPITTAHPNDLWTADFKGHFRTGDGVYRYPLTVADQHTRYLLACHGLFDRLFREHGLPEAIRTTTPSGPTNSSTARRPRRAIGPRAVRIPGRRRPSSILATSSSSASRTPGRSGSSTSCSSSPSRCTHTPLASRRWPTASGRFTSVESCWDGSINETASFTADDHSPSL